MPKKGENIYKRKDGRWEGRYIKSRTESGKIIYGYVYARSYRETKEKQKAKIASYTSQIANKNEHVFSNIASEWFESIKLHTKTSTQNKYHRLPFTHKAENSIAVDFAISSSATQRSFKKFKYELQEVVIPEIDFDSILN